MDAALTFCGLWLTALTDEITESGRDIYSLGIVSAYPVTTLELVAASFPVVDECAVVVLTMLAGGAGQRRLFEATEFCDGRCGFCRSVKQNVELSI